MEISSQKKIKKPHQTMRLSIISILLRNQGIFDVNQNLNSTRLKKPAPFHFKIKHMKEISMEVLFEAKPLATDYRAFYHSAFSSYQAWQAQNLYLFNLIKIYHEKKFFY